MNLEPYNYPFVQNFWILPATQTWTEKKFFAPSQFHINIKIGSVFILWRGIKIKELRYQWIKDDILFRLLQDITEVDRDYMPGLVCIRDMDGDSKAFAAMDMSFSTPSAAGHEVGLSMD
jgi:hypothetical protein